MPQRFALRIESGDQAGETHAISSAGLTVGRRPGNELVLRDASISGRHARFSIENDKVVLVDFGSTNGTFVDDKRVEESTLEAGAFLRLGKVEVELISLEGAPAVAPMPASAPPPRPAPKAAPAPVSDEIELEIEDDLELEDHESEAPSPVAAASAWNDGLDAGVLDSLDDDNDGMHEVDAAALAAAGGGRSKAPLLAGVVVLGGAAAWYFMGMPGLGSDQTTSGPTKRQVVQVPGNLINDPSFEGNGWPTDEEADLTPFTSDAWRFSGDLGMGLDLEAGETARLSSPVLSLGRQRGLTAAAMALTDGSGAGRLGIAFSDAAGEFPAFTAFGPAFSDGEGEQLLELTAPAGYDQARLVLDFASPSAPGGVGFDDVSLVASGTEIGVISHGSFGLATMGHQRLALGFIDRPLLVAMTGTAPKDAERGVEFNALDQFAVTVDAGLFGQGLATLGSGGYRPHGDAFSDEGVTSVVIGSGVHQLRLVMASPVTMTGRQVASGYRLEASGAAGTCQIELGFVEERAMAARLNGKARDAEQRGERGEALAFWKQLLDDVPFEGALVLSAEAGRSRLIDAGLSEVGALKNDLERARFFGLADLYRECLAGVLLIKDEFEGSEVTPSALELETAVRAALASMDGQDLKVARLRSARAAVLEMRTPKDPDGSPKLPEDGLTKHIKAAVNAEGTKESN